MKNTLKRILAVITAAIMVFGAVPMASAGGDIMFEYTDGIFTYEGMFGDKYGVGWSIEKCNTSASGVVHIPDEVDGTYVVGISGYDKDIFKDCNNITAFSVSPDNKNHSVVDGVLFNKEMTKIIAYPIGKKDSSYTIPESVVEIGVQCFYGCENLKEINIHDNIENINEEAFFNSGLYLDEANWDNGILYCGNYLIAGNKDTASGKITVRNGTIFIADSACKGCDKITELVIPEDVNIIKFHAFEDCSSLTDVVIGNGTSRIFAYAFNNCKNLKKISIPSSIISIANYVFSGTALTDVYYGGSQADFEKIDISYGNSPFLNATIHYATDNSGSDAPPADDDNGNTDDDKSFDILGFFAEIGNSVSGFFSSVISTIKSIISFITSLF